MVYTAADRERHLIPRDEALRIAYRLGVVRIIATGLEAIDAANLATPRNRTDDAEQILHEIEQMITGRRSTEEAAALRSAPLANAPDQRAMLDQCTGADDCTAPLHVHGCYADHGLCNERDQHYRR